MNYFNGEIYTGEWRNDLRSGIGTLIFTNMDKYIGQWRDDKNMVKQRIYLKVEIILLVIGQMIYLEARVLLIIKMVITM